MNRYSTVNVSRIQLFVGFFIGLLCLPHAAKAQSNSTQKNLSEYSIAELFSDRNLSPSRKPAGRFSPDGLHLLAVVNASDSTGAYWQVTKTPIQPSTKKSSNKSTDTKTQENTPQAVNSMVVFDSRDYRKEQSQLFPSKNLQGDFTLSPDGNFMLVTYDPQQIYRHSFSSMGYVVDLKQKRITYIPVRMMYPTLSPNNQWLSYVANNNIYILHLTSQNVFPITTDGKTNSIINGAVDWVYEEEFTMDNGMAWSPSGNHLAYYRFDETRVKEFSMDAFGKDLYPSQIQWKYPKAGEDNSLVSVWLCQIPTPPNDSDFIKHNFARNFPTRELLSTASDDSYLPRIQWADQSDILFIQKLNRWQNHWQLFSLDARSGNDKNLAPSLVIEEKDKAYVEIPDKLLFVPNSQNLIYTSEKSGFNHLYLLNYEKKTCGPITSGNWDVVSPLGYISQTKTVLFTATKQNVLEDHLYSIGLSGKNLQLLSVPGYNYSIQLGPNGWFYYETRTRLAHISPVGKSQIALGDSTLNYVDAAYELRLKSLTSPWETLVYENNKWSQNWLSAGARPIEFRQFQSSNHGTSFTQLESVLPLNAYVIYPTDFDPKKKYPVLMHIYGGPGSNQVKNAFLGRNFLWHNYLAAKGYMVVVVDNRGTGRRGANFKKSTYLQLGKLEALDHAAVAQQLGQLPYVDSNRIGIWGWSFGGYMSSLAITKSPNTFKTAIAVAPVTSWRYYDNIYTERFLRRPQDNPTGYDENSPINFTKGIKGNYLLIHGSGDDNVHWQNSAMMINSMIESGAQYNFEIYPNRNHGIGDPAASKHLYTLMTRYILENL